MRSGSHHASDPEEPIWSLSLKLLRPGAYVTLHRPNGEELVFRIVQVEQDMAMCQEKFPELICKPIAAQFMAENVIALFSFEQSTGDLTRVESEKQYKLVPSTELTGEELESYRVRNPD